MDEVIRVGITLPQKFLDEIMQGRMTLLSIDFQGIVERDFGLTEQATIIYTRSELSGHQDYEAAVNFTPGREV